ncbi:MAG: hypothetical protein H0Z34_12470 [Brevibacillus sp.]|nr:hypothetical protein [Brevibacillus sp.]
MTKRDAAADLAMCEAATPGPWKWVGLQHPTCGSMYSPPEPYYPAEVYVELDDDRLLSDDMVAIARLDDPVYLVETDEEGDTGERYLGTANDNARFFAEAREALPYWIRRAVEAEKENNSHRAVMEEAVARLMWGDPENAIDVVVDILKRHLAMKD